MNKSEKSLVLYDMMLKMGYPKEFSDLITQNLNTDWTAGRLIGYLSYNGKMSPEDVADEMLAILSDRQRIMDKKNLEYNNALWNAYMAEGFGDDDD